MQYQTRRRQLPVYRYRQQHSKHKAAAAQGNINSLLDRFSCRFNFGSNLPRLSRPACLTTPSDSQFGGAGKVYRYSSL